jgi:hypothetical protein
METDKKISKFVMGLLLKQGHEDAKRIINENLAKTTDEQNINFYTRAKALVEKLKDVRSQ